MVSRAVGRAVGLCPACVSRGQSRVAGQLGPECQAEALRGEAGLRCHPGVTLRVMAALAEKQEASGCEGRQPIAVAKGGTALSLTW